MSPTRARWRLYVFLVFLRIFIGFTSLSVIHPDEHFQNPEIAVGIVFNYSQSGGVPFRTWEWMGTEPARSIAPLVVSSQAAFSVVRAMFGNNVTAEVLFFAQRAVMLLLSLVIDLCIYKTSRSLLSLLLFASSPVVFTFLVRPFSNSLETVAFALSFLFAFKILSNKSKYLLPLGVVLAFGVWTRVTFVAFAFTLVVAIVYHLSRQDSSKPFNLFSLFKRGSPAIFSFFSTAYLLAGFDTRHYLSKQTLSHILTHPSLLIITPLNLLKYNLSADNLAQHGLHPRYLHALVNLPILFGVELIAVLAIALRTLKKPRKREETKDRKSLNLDRLLLASFVVPLGLLSIQPHQEPRFLVPLIVPLVLLVPQTSYLTTSTSHWAHRKKRYFWSLWILHSCLFTLFFGYLHQGGLLPTLLELNRELKDSSSKIFGGDTERIELVFWKTFMAPRHLLLPLNDGSAISMSRKISITDLGGVSFANLTDLLASTIDPTTPSSSSQNLPALSKTFLVSPSYLFDPSLLHEASASSSSTTMLCAQPVTIGRERGLLGAIHLDTDRMGEMVEGFGKLGFAGLGIGVWEIVEC